jgi:hypothetical protein
VDHPAALEAVVSADGGGSEQDARGAEPALGAGERVLTPGVRVLGVAGLSLLIVLSGTLLTRAGTSPPPPPPPGAAVASGSWFCPHGGGSGWKGWIAVFNPGRAPVQVRTTTFDGGGPTLVRTFTLAPSREVYREVPVSDPASATQVEFFGGWVAAGAIVRSEGSSADVAAERCVDGYGRTWAMPDATTAVGEQAAVVVMNPYASAAEFNVVIRTDQPRTVRPGALTPVVLEPHRSTSIAINPWALEGPSEHTVTVEVVPVFGRVIAGSLVVSPDGVRAEAGIAVPSSRWVIPAAGYGSSARMEVLNNGRRTARLNVVAEGPEAANTLPDVTGATVTAQGAATFDVGAVEDAGMHVDTGRSPVAIALRLSGTNGGEATTTGWAQVGTGWAVPPALPSTGGSAELLLQNPERRPAAVRITWIGPGGPVRGATTVDVPGARTISVDVPGAGVPVFALVNASRGSIVAAMTAQSIGTTAFAATSGIPLP